MSPIKNGQISLFCHFNEFIKNLGTSFQSTTLSKNYVRNVCHTANWYLTNFHFDSNQDSKEISMCKFHYFAMPMMTSHILKSLNFTKTQKSRYLKNKTLFFVQI